MATIAVCAVGLVVVAATRFAHTPNVSPRPVSVDRADDAIQGAPAAAAADCVFGDTLKPGVHSESVTCLKRHLRDEGYLSDEQLTGVPQEFDAITTDAVIKFQEEHGLEVDGVVGPRTGMALQAWRAPDAVAPDADTCPDSGHGAVIDRNSQRAWLCDNGAIHKVIPVTTSDSQPAPGTYRVFDKDREATSTFSGQTSSMEYFVVFASGRYTGARVGFHSVPKYADGSFAQSLDSVGTIEQFGASSGCIRALPDAAAEIWDWLDYDDEVVVAS